MLRRILMGAALGLAAMPALAQDAVTVYGRVDMSYSRQARVFAAGRPTGDVVHALDSGGYNGSRLGFRGVEDLGGGLKALFVLEMGIQADTGVLAQGGREWGRQSYLGLENRFARLTLGRQYTPWFETLSLADPFGNNLVGNSGNVAFANARVDNALLLRSQKFGGFSAQALWALGEGGAAGSQRNLAASYEADPLWVGVAYGEQKAATTGSFAIIGASWKVGPVKLFGHVTRLKDINPTVQPAPSLQPGSRGSSWLLGGSAALGAGTLIVSVVDLDDERALDRDARQYAAGYVYPLSKRTSLYAATARIVNRNGGTLTVNTPSYVGRGEQQTQLGVSHAF